VASNTATTDIGEMDTSWSDNELMEWTAYKDGTIGVKDNMYKGSLGLNLLDELKLTTDPSRILYFDLDP
jgi:hypothetical protein